MDFSWKKFKEWSSEEGNYKAINSAGSLATVAAVLVALALGYQQNEINKNLLNLEETKHIPILEINVKDFKVEKPTGYDSWGIHTEFSITNEGLVPIQILGYIAGKEIGTTQGGEMEEKFFQNYRPEINASTTVDIISTSQTETHQYGFYGYKTKPQELNGYKLRVFYKEYPDGMTQCKEIRYYKTEERTVTEFTYSCGLSFPQETNK